LVIGGAPALADEYTSWKKDEVKKTYTCTYSYTPKDPAVTKKYEQTVVVYYGDKDRSGWAYYYNADNKPWARCAIPGNTHYNPKVMYWENLKPDGTGYDGFKDKDGKYYAAGYCPAPKDGKKPIADLPLPPK
jgi:hypothetical protein